MTRRAASPLAVHPRVRRLRRPLLLLAALLPGACRSSETVGLACTNIGCISGLTVGFEGGPAVVPYRLELTTSSGPDVVYSAQCADPAACGTGSFFADLLPDRVFVTVITAGGRATFERAVPYETSYPNGRRCGPGCRFGTVRVPRPER